jgi:hypothetical protein
MPRTKNAKGKPKVIGVKLETLNSIFKPETVVYVDVRYAAILNVTEADLDKMVEEQKVCEPAIQYQIKR